MGVELRGVTKQRGSETHIYETDLSLERGEFNVLLGTTLAGKTTLMRLMAGLERPTSGEVWHEGVNVTGVAVQKRNVAMVYQAFVNYPNFTVFDNIASPLRVAGVAAEQVRQRVAKIAEMLRLTPMLQRLPSELSGGQQQRTALARALVKDAALVLLDEPLANLDYKLREELREELPRLFQDSGATVVYATSEPLEALMLGGYTATLQEGRVIDYGPTVQVYRAPRSLVSARVFSDPPLNTAVVDKRGVRFFLTESVSWTAPAKHKDLADGSYTIGIRPHHLTIGATDEDVVKVRAKVLVAEISGSESIVHADVEGNLWISESHGIHPFEVGDTAELFLNTGRCLYFDTHGHLISN